MYVAFVLIVLVFVLAFGGTEGLWSNAIRLVNVILAALIATNYFEPVAVMLEDILSGYFNAGIRADFAALCLVFAAAMMVLRAVTDRLSREQVRFLPWVNRAGGYLLAAFSGWVLICFLSMALHTAPLPYDLYPGGIHRDAEERRAFYANQQAFEEWVANEFASYDLSTRRLAGTAPDRKWLAFMRKVSLGSLGRSRDPKEFDPAGDFIFRYEARRLKYEHMDRLALPGQRSR